MSIIDIQIWCRHFNFVGSFTSFCIWFLFQHFVAILCRFSAYCRLFVATNYLPFFYVVVLFEVVLCFHLSELTDLIQRRFLQYCRRLILLRSFKLMSFASACRFSFSHFMWCRFISIFVVFGGCEFFFFFWSISGLCRVSFLLLFYNFHVLNLSRFIISMPFNFWVYLFSCLCRFLNVVKRNTYLLSSFPGKVVFSVGVVFLLSFCMLICQLIWIKKKW